MCVYVWEAIPFCWVSKICMQQKWVCDAEKTTNRTQCVWGRGVRDRDEAWETFVDMVRSIKAGLCVVHVVMCRRSHRHWVHEITHRGQRHHHAKERGFSRVALLGKGICVDRIPYNTPHSISGWWCERGYKWKVSVTPPEYWKKKPDQQWIEYRWRDERMSVCGILTAITPLDNIKAQAQAKALMVGFAGAEFTMGQGGRG